MLMTKRTDGLTALAELLLDTVNASGSDGVTRLQIAQRIGRPMRLNPHDVELLEMLTAEGYIAAEDRKLGPVKTERVYKAKV